MRKIAFVLFIVFLVLKLAEVGVIATWSWLLVFSPLLIWFLVWMLFILIVAIVAEL